MNINFQRYQNSTSYFGDVIVNDGKTGVLTTFDGSANSVILGAATRLQSTGVAFASLGAPGNGTIIYCSDCTKATPCASGGNGAVAKRLNGAWDCD